LIFTLRQCIPMVNRRRGNLCPVSKDEKVDEIRELERSLKERGQHPQRVKGKLDKGRCTEDGKEVEMVMSDDIKFIQSIIISR